MNSYPLPRAADVELDVRALFMSLVRALPYLIVLAGVVAVGSLCSASCFA